MNQKEQIKSDSTTPSLLDSFTLGFEYDKTINQVKRDTKTRGV